MAHRIDPRWYQITVLALLATYGSAWLALEVELPFALAAVAAALAVQAFGVRIGAAPAPFEPKSALISALSLTLLLRASEPWLLGLAGALAIASKLTIRWRGKHLFNPSCFAIVALLATTDGVWVSAGQWGSGPLVALFAAGLGSLVLYRSARSDITWAFLGSYAALVLARALWLGDPLDVAVHPLKSGSLLIFAFFMISDPRSTPDSRTGRVAFAAAVAALATYLQFGLYWTNPLLWSLAALAPLVPVLDAWRPHERYRWSARTAPTRAPGPHTPFPFIPKEKTMKALSFALACAVLLAAGPAQAFCGFYVAKADAKLFNRASQVVIARDGPRTVITMSNDFQGEPDEFAMVIPVPTFLEREQIHVGDRKVIEHLDAYTAPRLVEYFDGDPCRQLYVQEDMLLRRSLPASEKAEGLAGRARSLGVRIEASYTVGEYDILILSAEQSNGLATWLRESGYRLPDGAEEVLASYLKQDMRFFVAKVNLSEQRKLGFSYLRPIQVAYESPKFMLPIRLGTLNADGPQELFVYTLTRKGRVETTNYRTTRLPSGSEVPAFVKAEFGDFYRAMFDEQVRRENMRTVFLEYAWDMNWCDPCAADPLSDQELRSLGVFWADAPGRFPPRGKSAARNVFVTRLHVRYDAEHFPADLVFQETGDRQNFQGRYVIRHAFDGEATCPAADRYREVVAERQAREAETLANLTGWSLADIRKRLPDVRPVSGPRPWWERLWE